MSRIDQIISAKHRVYGLKVPHNGKEFFYFIEVDKDKEQQFLDDLAADDKKIFLHEYGEILEEGVYPPDPELTQYLTKKYKLS